ncbi:MAG TPA: hypothetical protein H9894_08165 [Candidatus Desulfovibrio intestinipullorum]|uniref:Uncharacterized protein n=1 Tax=Candidatus Desulfovibrio intestinipullorum TaxID=2838536 RepID=A0A9D1TR59_9BACT|nr:hypothetical protein [Candidatus Desulfovibrio intestinipullorum]
MIRFSSCQATDKLARLPRLSQGLRPGPSRANPLKSQYFPASLPLPPLGDKKPARWPFSAGLHPTGKDACPSYGLEKTVSGYFFYGIEEVPGLPLQDMPVHSHAKNIFCYSFVAL